MNKSLFIEELMEKNDFCLADTAMCYRANKNKIDSMMEIFSEKDDSDKNLVATIPLILNPEYAEIIQNYYDPKHKSLEDLEAYKLQILTALQYNNRFFAYSCNWCSYTLYKAKKTQKNTTIIMPDWKNILSSEIVIRNCGLAAAPKNEVVTIFSETDDLKLTIKWDEQNNEIYFTYYFGEGNIGKKYNIKILIKGLFDMRGHEITEIFLDGEVDELGEVHKVVKADFSSNFTILGIYMNS